MIVETQSCEFDDCCFYSNTEPQSLDCSMNCMIEYWLRWGACPGWIDGLLYFCLKTLGARTRTDFDDCTPCWVRYWWPRGPPQRGKGAQEAIDCENQNLNHSLRFYSQKVSRHSYKPVLEVHNTCCKMKVVESQAFSAKASHRCSNCRPSSAKANAYDVPVQVEITAELAYKLKAELPNPEEVTITESSALGGLICFTDAKNLAPKQGWAQHTSQQRGTTYIRYVFLLANIFSLWSESSSRICLLMC